MADNLVGHDLLTDDFLGYNLVGHDLMDDLVADDYVGSDLVGLGLMGMEEAAFGRIQLEEEISQGGIDSQLGGAVIGHLGVAWFDFHHNLHSGILFSTNVD